MTEHRFTVAVTMIAAGLFCGLLTCCASQADEDSQQELQGYTPKCVSVSVVDYDSSWDIESNIDPGALCHLAHIADSLRLIIARQSKEVDSLEAYWRLVVAHRWPVENNDSCNYDSVCLDLLRWVRRVREFHGVCGTRLSEYCPCDTVKAPDYWLQAYKEARR